MAVDYKLGKNFLLTSVLVLCGLLILASPNLASADTTGSLLPSSDGTYTSWTPKSGSTHYTMVDEATCNGTTDYNSTATVGNRDSYGISLSSVPDGATITSVAITPCASRNSSGGSGSATMNVFYRFDGTNSADAGAYALSGTTPTSLSATNFNSLSLVKGSASTLQIGAVYSAGTKGARLSRVATVLTYTPLVAPSALSASAASQTQINLSWTDNSSNETGFKVERSSTGATGPFTEITTTSANATSFSDIGLTPGTTYHYRVRATNTGGNSSYTGVYVATTFFNAPTVTTNSASSVTTSSATLNGSANPNSATATGWFRYSTSNPGACDDSFGTRAPVSSGTNLGAGSSAVAYFQGISGLSSDTTYYVCAISSNSGGTSFGSVQSFSTLQTSPTAPSTLGASGVSSSAIDLSWTDNSSNETGFKVERSIFGPSSGFVQIATTSAGVQTFNDTGLSTVTTYWYRVRAFNGAGNSSYSNVSSGTTLDVLPNAPTGLSVTVATSTNAVINWADNSSNEDEFVVEKSTDGVDFSVLASTTSNTIQYVDSGLTTGTYYYRVKAVNEIGSSAYTSVGSVNIP